MTKIDSSVCIITGAASGIGRELAIQALKRGASKIIATDVNTEQLNETGELACRGRDRSLFESHCFDIGSAHEIEQFVQLVQPTLADRRLILFNNAGMALCSGRFQDTPLDDFERLLNVNLLGVIRLTKAFYPYLLEKGEGHVVNISSVFGLFGMDGHSAYCTSKFGVRGFTETLRMELFDSNVNVTCVHPGGIRTNIARNSKIAGPTMDQAKYEQMVKEFDQVSPTTAASAATQILDAVEKNNTRLLIGSDARQIDWLARIFPVRYTKMAIARLKKSFSDPYKK